MSNSGVGIWLRLSDQKSSHLDHMRIAWNHLISQKNYMRYMIIWQSWFFYVKVIYSYVMLIQISTQSSISMTVPCFVRKWPLAFLSRAKSHVTAGFLIYLIGKNCRCLYRNDSTYLWATRLQVDTGQTINRSAQGPFYQTNG